jgi:nitroreductase
MNETIKSILGRRSVRSYEKRPVEKEKIDAIIECGLYAPSGMDKQTWHFSVVTDRALLDRISEANRAQILKSDDVPAPVRIMAESPNFDSFRGAPMAIIVSGDASEKNACADCANAVENMAIAAYSLGLGSCYLASFKICMETPEGAHFKKELQIPEGYEPLYALAIGYGNEKLGERSPRKKNAVSYIG